MSSPIQGRGSYLLQHSFSPGSQHNFSTISGIVICYLLSNPSTGSSHENTGTRQALFFMGKRREDIELSEEMPSAFHLFFAIILETHQPSCARHCTPIEMVLDTKEFTTKTQKEQGSSKVSFFPHRDSRIPALRPLCSSLFQVSLCFWERNIALGPPTLVRLRAGTRPSVKVWKFNLLSCVTCISARNHPPGEPTWVKIVFPEESYEPSYDPCSTKHFSNWLHIPPSCEEQSEVLKLSPSAKILCSPSSDAWSQPARDT